jgi:oxygen-independent coproporphyrinogen-3 oxidase
MAVDHLSLYQLTIEDGTAFGDRYARGKLRGLPPDDLSADMYKATQDICADAGYLGYEISNHARSGAESRHNRVYWRYGDYIGIGPGAHGRLSLDGQRYATEAWSNPAKWLDLVERAQTEKERSSLTGEDQASEFLMMGLRLTEGVDQRRFEVLSGQSLPLDRIEYLTSLGMINVHGPVLTVTPQGRMVLNAILAELLAG